MTTPHAYDRSRQRQFGLDLKIYGIVLLAAVGIGLTSALALWNIRGDLGSTKRNELSHLVQTAISTIKAFDDKVKSGTLPLDVAQEQAKTIISSMRYQGDQYFWINDMKPRMVMHPIKPALDGKNLSDMKDPNGTLLFMEFVKTVRDNGAGFVSYLWPKPGQKEPQPKLSYVEGYTPWGWIVGSGVYVDDLENMIWSDTKSILGMALVVLILITVLSLFVGKSITSPLSRLEKAMKALAEGQIHMDIPGRNRRDEIGQMASAVEVFRSHAVRKKELEEEQQLHKQRTEAERHSLMAKLIDEFDADVGGIVKGISAAAMQLQEISQSMAQFSDLTSDQAQTAESASARTAANVETVATAAEELTSSIAEINQQVTRASSAARRAVEDVEKTGVQMTKLEQTAHRISDVVKMISDVADQTNLLALNATIESARAGEAGKGFAVVASEVKALAGQTAKATEEIITQIASIQSATRDAVVSINDIGAVIRDVDATSSGIAAAMEQQGAATREIARNVNHAAVGTEEVRKNITAVSGTSKQTEVTAGQVASAADELSRQASQLAAGVGNFVAHVRTA